MVTIKHWSFTGFTLNVHGFRPIVQSARVHFDILGNMLSRGLMNSDEMINVN